MSKRRMNGLFCLIGAVPLLVSGCATPGESPGSSSLSFPAQVALATVAKMGDAKATREIFRPAEKECVFDSKRSEQENEISFNSLVDRIASEQIGLDSKQRKEAFNIIKTGEFQHDLQSTVTGIFKAGVRIPNATTSTIKTLPQLLKSPTDLFWKNPLAQDAREVARVLTASENRSVRLAIIAYANMQGLKIKESDLDLLHSELGNPNGPDLNTLANEAVNRFSDSIPGKDLVNQFKSFDESCHI